MVELTDNAHKALIEHFEGKEIQPVRIFVTDGGCAGDYLNVVLDQVRDTDEIFDFDGGIKIVVHQDLIKEAAPLKLDCGDLGFSITSPMEFKSDCGNCASAGTCGH